MSNESPQLEPTPKQPGLYMAMDLGGKSWKLGFAKPGLKKQRITSVSAGDLDALVHHISLAKARLKLPEDAPVYSCYEAGRDGFWIHRYLDSIGVINIIIDPASIATNRRKRRVKTDKVDVRKMLKGLLRYHRGEEDDWSTLSIPNRQQEDWRRIHRELERLKKERTQHTNRIKGLLQTQGIKLKVNTRFLASLESVRLFDGSKLPVHLEAELVREYERRQLVERQIKGLNSLREEYIQQLKATDEWEELEVEPQEQEVVVQPESSTQASIAPEDTKQTEAPKKAEPKKAEPKKSLVPPLSEQECEVLKKVVALMSLCGIGMESGWLFVMEVFGWRVFDNRRQLGSFAGLTPTPHQSDGISREQGISKAGNRRVRAMMIQIGWSWLRYQPTSQLSLWFNERFGKGGKRMRRVGIVALSRKLLIELWKFVEKGELPQGAKLK